MSTELLRMTGIVKTFPGVRALDGVDLDVRRGENVDQCLPAAFES